MSENNEGEGRGEKGEGEEREGRKGNVCARVLLSYSLCMYMYVYMCMCMYMYIYLFVYVTVVFVEAWIFTCMSIFTCMYVSIMMYTSLCVCVCVCVFVCEWILHTNIQFIDNYHRSLYFQILTNIFFSLYECVPIFVIFTVGITSPLFLSICYSYHHHNRIVLISCDDWIKQNDYSDWWCSTSYHSISCRIVSNTVYCIRYIVNKERE